MNEVKITELNELESANVNNNDVLPIVDISADETKKIKVQNIKTTVNDSYSTSTTETYSANYINSAIPEVHDSYNSSTTEPYSANYINNLPSGEGGGIIALKSITTAPSTFSEGDKYYNATDDLIYTATSSSTWDEGTTASAVSLYLNEIDNELYRYYNNAMNLLESGSGGGGSIEVGTIFQYPGTTAPTNYMICDGSAISRTTYADLFAVIGTTYGSGDGSTTFNIPDLKGRVVVGLDGNDTAFDTLGETGGEKTHKLAINELPKATPTFKGGNDGNFNMTYVGTGGNFAADTTVQVNQNNLQPYTVLNYIIKVTQSAGGGETLPVGTEIDFDGNVSDIPAGWVQVDDVPVYSTTETICGTWIDGETLYRKVIDFGTLPDNTIKTVNSGLNNVLIWHMYGIARNSTGSTITIPEANGSNTIRLVFNDSNQVEIATTYNRSSFYGYVVLEYTKTTN